MASAISDSNVSTSGPNTKCCESHTRVTAASTSARMDAYWRFKSMRGTCMAGGLFAECIAQRIAAIPTEALARDLHAGGRLPALVFRGVEQPLHARHRLARKPAGDDLRHAQLLLDEPLEDGVELFVRRQRVLVRLVRAQLRRRRLGDG